MRGDDDLCFIILPSPAKYNKRCCGRRCIAFTTMEANHYHARSWSFACLRASTASPIVTRILNSSEAFGADLRRRFNPHLAPSWRLRWRLKARGSSARGCSCKWSHSGVQKITLRVAPNLRALTYDRHRCNIRSVRWSTECVCWSNCC